MQWTHILAAQPEYSSIIIQMHEPFELYKGDFKNHYIMGMKEYKESLPWEDYMEWIRQNNAALPDYWWIYAKDFPFPEKRFT